MFQQPDLFAGASIVSNSQSLADVIGRITACSRRPRYAFMVLNLIAEAAGQGDSAGPYIKTGKGSQPIRDWLCDALIPMAQNGFRRKAITDKVIAELKSKRLMPKDSGQAEGMIEEEVRKHVRQSARCNVSTAVSDLVRAGLVRRHYQGYRVDHHNRGAQREAVYTLTSDAKMALLNRI